MTFMTQFVSKFLLMILYSATLALTVTSASAQESFLLWTKTASCNILFQDDFETSGSFSSHGWYQEGAYMPETNVFFPYAATRVTTPARYGNHAVRFELRRADCIDNARTELALPSVPQLSERWYAFSIYLPSGGEEDYKIDEKSGEILAQWHGYPDTAAGEGWTNPPLALSIWNDHWVIASAWDENVVTPLPIPSDKKISINLGEFANDKGKWTDWVFHVKWGWDADEHDLKLEVYKNGVKVVDRNGLPNTTNDKRGTYFKMGIYKWHWKENVSPSSLQSRVIYHDGILIGDENCTLRDFQQ